MYICTVYTVDELCEKSAICHLWWHIAVYPFGCNVCHCFTSPLGDCLLQTLNSFLGEKQNPKTPPASLFTPLLCVQVLFLFLSLKTLPFPHKHTHKGDFVCGCLQGTDACTCVTIIVKKMEERWESGDTHLTWQLFLSPCMTAIHLHKEYAPCVLKGLNTLHLFTYITKEKEKQNKTQYQLNLD